MIELFAALATLAVGVLFEATIGIKWNMRGMGTLLAVCILGGLILWAVRHPKEK